MDRQIDLQHSLLPKKKLPWDLRFILPLNGTKLTAGQFVPFFWHIHKTGGSYVRKVCNLGYKLKPKAMLGSQKEINMLYRRMSGLPETEEDHREAVAECQNHAENLEKASKLGVKDPWTLQQKKSCVPLVAMTLPEHKCLPECLNFIQTPEIYLSEKIFSKTTKKARVATLLRDPIQRFISMFTYLKTATWETNFNPTSLSLNDYILSGEYKKLEWSGNWMVCTLSQCGKSNVNSTTETQLELAKQVLGNIMIGFTDNMKDFFIRLEKYWQIPSSSQKRARRNVMNLSVNVQKNKTSSNLFLSPEASSILHASLIHDIKLYSYAKEVLWDEQEKLLHNLG